MGNVILGGGRRRQDTFALDRRIEEQSSYHSVRRDMLTSIPACRCSCSPACAGAGR